MWDKEDGQCLRGGGEEREVGRVETGRGSGTDSEVRTLQTGPRIRPNVLEDLVGTVRVPLHGGEET